MHVRLIDTRRRADVAAFVQFPFTLYRDCPQWCPPLAASVARGLDRDHHPFYAHSAADFFIVEDGGAVRGRIAVLENRNYNAHQQKRTGFFCHFDVVEDPVAADALLTAAFDWMRARGLNEAFGPHGLIKLDHGGVLVEGYDHPAAMGIAWNHPYYDTYLGAAGFTPHTDFLSGHLERGQRLPERLRQIATKACARSGFSIKTFASKAELRAWTPRLAATYDRAFQGFSFYYPRTPAERDLFAAEMIRVADPRLIKLVMRGETIAGFLLTFPDLAAGLRRARGRLWPCGWWHLRQAARRGDWCDITHAGLLPEFRGRGANLVLYTELERTLYECGYQQADVQLIPADNPLSIADNEAVGVRWYKRHRLYRRSL